MSTDSYYFLSISTAYFVMINQVQALFKKTERVNGKVQKSDLH